LVGVLAAAIKKVTGKQPSVVGIPAFTVAGTLRSRGIPTVAFGPGDLAACHTANEKIREKELFEFVGVLLELLGSTDEQFLNF
jgi:acetylornithine deacetylase/succinyl-diaminopimelate desuccinylase-like protein